MVVGARAAGAATALLLGRLGHNVVLVDRALFPADTVSTHQIARTGVVALHRWGLLSAVLASGAPAIRQIEFNAAGREPVTRRVKDRAGVDLLVAPRRYVLDTLVAEAAARAGVHMRLGVVVSGVRRDDTGRVVGVIGRDRAGSTVRIDARFVVGADGLGSRVARSVAAPVTEYRGNDGAVQYAYFAGLDWPGIELFIADRAIAGVFPTHDGEACVWVCAPSVDTRAARRCAASRTEAFLTQLHHAAPGLAARLRAGRRTSPVAGMLRAPNQVRLAHGPGWALVGDAGYYKDPLTSHGMTDALRDAELLARALVAILADGADERETLAGYQRTRDALSVAFFDITDVIAGHRWTLEEIPDLLRQARAANAGEVDALTALPPLPSPPCATPWRSGGSPDPDQTCETARLGDQAVSTRRR